MTMLSILLAVALLCTSVALGVVVFRRPGAISVANEAPSASDSDEIAAELAHDFALMKAEFEELRVAVAHGIEHVQRTERRIKNTVHRARKELEESGLEHEGLNAEITEISEWDGGGGPAEGLPVMHQDVVPSQSSIPGVTSEQLARIRSI